MSELYDEADDWREEDDPEPDADWYDDDDYREPDPEDSAIEQAYYEEHKQEYAQPEQIRLSEILVPTPADANDDVVAQAKAKATENPT